MPLCTSFFFPGNGVFCQMVHLSGRRFGEEKWMCEIFYLTNNVTGGMATLIAFGDDSCCQLSRLQISSYVTCCNTNNRAPNHVCFHVIITSSEKC